MAQDEPELWDQTQVAEFLGCSYNRVNYVNLHDPFFPKVHSRRIVKKTGKHRRFWIRAEIEKFQADRVLRSPEYRKTLRKQGRAVPPSQLPTAILTKEELREECDRLRALVAELSESTNL